MAGQNELEKLLRNLVWRITQLEQRQSEMMQPGTVAAVKIDGDGHLVRLRHGGTDDAPVLGPWMPYAQIAGGLKVHTPPTVGQQMVSFNPAGDRRQGVALPFTWSDAVPSPSDKADENVITFGQMRLVLKAESILLAGGDQASVEITPSKITAKVGGSTITIEGEKIEAKSELIQTDGKTVLDKGTAKVVTEDGPALRVFAKV